MARKPTIAPAAQLETPHFLSHHSPFGFWGSDYLHRTWVLAKPTLLSPLLQAVPSVKDIPPTVKLCLPLRRPGSPLASERSPSRGLVFKALLTPTFYFLLNFPRSRPPLSPDRHASAIPDLRVHGMLRYQNLIVKALTPCCMEKRTSTEYFPEQPGVYRNTGYQASCCSCSHRLP